MKLVVLLVCVLGLVAGEEVARRYHQRVGIPAASAIRRQESKRVAGGVISYSGQHPFFAGLVITLTTGETSICGGVMLSHTQVLTAAQCWWDGYSQAKTVLVVLGSTRLFSYGTRTVARSCTVHGLYDADKLQNDIAMLKTYYVYYNSYIKPIAVPTETNSTFVGSWVEAIGFGKTSNAAMITNSQVLHDAYLLVISNEQCNVTYAGVVTSNVMCTSGENRRGPCGGDAGGPLISRSPAGNELLIGLISFGASKGCTDGYPSGYTRVPSYASWINSFL